MKQKRILALVLCLAMILPLAGCSGAFGGGKKANVELLEAPVIKSVSTRDGYVRIEWEAVTGAEHYRVLRKLGDGNWTQIGDTTKLVFQDKNVQNGTKYLYTVCCVSADGKTVTSKYDEQGKARVYRDTPTLVSVQNISGGVYITWNAVDGVSNYRVSRKAEGEKEWTNIGTTGDTNFYDTSVVPGTTYAYTVRGISKDGKSTLTYFNTKGLSLKAE